MGKKTLLTIIVALAFANCLFAQVPPPPTPVCSLQVVVHVLHNNGPENISDSQVVDAIRILNEDFSKTNSDTADIIPQFRNIAADSRIRFALATVDPNGNATNGIDRIVSALTDSADDNSKINQWPPNYYVNIWVVKNMKSNTAGYAYHPDTIAAIGSQLDGLITVYSQIGSRYLYYDTFNIGHHYRAYHALTHIAGYYLGLIHPWGKSNNPGIQCGDDSIADTPLTKGWSSCPVDSYDMVNDIVTYDTSSTKMCHPKYLNGPSDSGIVENFQNFMEYTYCAAMFTEGQCRAIRATLGNSTASRDQLCNAVGVGIEQFESLNNEITLLPNPAFNQVQISYNIRSKSTVGIELFDALGRVMTSTYQTTVEAGKHTATMDVASIPQGLYFVKISFNGNLVFKRLMVVK